MPVDTKHAERRELSFDSIDDLVADLDRIEAAHNAGTLRHTGNWSPGQIFRHLAIFWRAAIDGFPPGRPALPMRWFFRLVIKPVALKGGPPPAGIKLPEKANFLIPDPDVSFDDALAEFRREIERVRSGGERFTHPSPVFGPLTHDQWTTLQLGHCTLHLSFLHPE